MSKRKFHKVRHRTDLVARPTFRNLSRVGNNLSPVVTGEVVNPQITDAVTQTEGSVG